jgi:hypothetical protein
MDRGFASMTWKLFAINTAAMGAMLGAVVAIAEF